jgi:hypothetical protein
MIGVARIAIVGYKRRGIVLMKVRKRLWTVVAARFRFAVFWFV